MIAQAEIPSFEELRSAPRYPRVHPNGFIQLDLDGGEVNGSGHLVTRRRLHVFPDIPIARQATDNPIHDHIFDMRSTVICGALLQWRRDYTLDHDGVPTHQIWTADYRNLHDTELRPTGVLVSESDSSCEEVITGGSYLQPAFTFHETKWRGLTATLMEKPLVYASFRPRVLCRIGEEPDNDFAREGCDEEEVLWDLIRRALEKARQS